MIKTLYLKIKLLFSCLITRVISKDNLEILISLTWLNIRKLQKADITPRTFKKTLLFKHEFNHCKIGSFYFSTRNITTISQPA